MPNPILSLAVKMYLGGRGKYISRASYMQNTWGKEEEEEGSKNIIGITPKANSGEEAYVVNLEMRIIYSNAGHVKHSLYIGLNKF